MCFVLIQGQRPVSGLVGGLGSSKSGGGPRGIGAFGVCRLGTSHVQVNICAANAGRTEKNSSRNWIEARIKNYADAEGLRSPKQIEAQQQPSKDNCS